MLLHVNLAPIVQSDHILAQYLFFASAIVSFLATLTLLVFSFEKASWLSTLCICMLSIGLLYAT
jgi:hypothetical protein